MILASRCNQIYHQNKIHTSCEKRVINTRLPHVTYRNNHQRRLPPVAAERPQAPSACFRLPSPPGAQTASQHCLPSRRLEPQPGACPQPMNQAGRLAGQAGGQGSGDCPFATPALPPLLRTPICCPQESGPPTSGIGQKTPGLVAAPERRRASPRRANARRPQVTQTSPVPPNETVHLRGRTRGNRVGAELVPPARCPLPTTVGGKNILEQQPELCHAIKDPAGRGDGKSAARQEAERGGKQAAAERTE